jgi:lipase chaperone LimK
MKKIFVFAALFLAAGLGLATWLMKAPLDTPAAAGSDVIPDTDSSGNTPAIPLQSGKDVDQEALARKGLTDMLRRQYGDNIRNPYWQLKMVEYLMDLFKRQYPDDWKTHLAQAIRDAFPDMADELIRQAERLDEYLSWLESLETTMTFQNEADRRKALWDKRIALFGDTAYTIWEADYKGEQFATRLKDLGQATGTFEEKVDQYVTLMEDVFGKNVLQSEGVHKTQIMTEFLGLQNVQGDLAGMDDDQRRSALREFREQMGLDDAALDRWDELDTQRDSEWAAGAKYLAEREALKQSLQGPALDKAIQELQDKLFGKDQATFIRNEEATGYCRYCEKRQIGNN